MKNFILGMTAAVALGALVIGTTSQASVWNFVTTTGWPTVEAAKFKVEAKGNDLRGYAFTPHGFDDVVCIFVTGDAKGGLSCLKNE